MTDLALPTVSIDEVRALLADPELRCWLIHATDTLSFIAGRIPGSLAQPDTRLLARLGEDVPIVIYGEHEHARAARALVTELHNLDVEVAWFAGGVAAWIAAGLQLERSDRPDG